MNINIDGEVLTCCVISDLYRDITDISAAFQFRRLTGKEVEKLGLCSAFIKRGEEMEDSPFSAVSPAPDLILNLYRSFHTSVYSKLDTFISFQTDGTSRPGKWNFFFFFT